MANKYELTDKGLATSDPIIASMFLGTDQEGRTTFSGYPLQGIKYSFVSGCYWFVDTKDQMAKKLMIPASAIREALKPIIGEAFIWIGYQGDENEGIELIAPYHGMTVNEKDDISWKAILFGQTYSELHTLIEWSKEEK